MKLAVAYGSHLPVLMKLLSITDGDVLEMGTGLFSTPYLHWACFEKRRLVSYENSAQYYRYNKGYTYNNLLHEIHLIDTWDEADIERPWDIALIDHSPEMRRKEDIKRLANFAKYIVVHDTQPATEHEYDYHEIYPLFKYRYDFTKHPANTSVLSNLVDLADLNI